MFEYCAPTPNAYVYFKVDSVLYKVDAESHQWSYIAIGSRLFRASWHGEYLDQLSLTEIFPQCNSMQDEYTKALPYAVKAQLA